MILVNISLCEENLFEALIKVCHCALNFAVLTPPTLKYIIIVIIVSAEAMLHTLFPFTDVLYFITRTLGCICKTSETIEFPIEEMTLIP